MNHQSTALFESNQTIFDVKQTPHDTYPLYVHFNDGRGYSKFIKSNSVTAICLIQFGIQYTTLRLMRFRVFSTEKNGFRHFLLSK